MNIYITHPPRGKFLSLKLITPLKAYMTLLQLLTVRFDIFIKGGIRTIRSLT